MQIIIDGPDTEKNEKFPLAAFLKVKSSANILRDLRHSLVQYDQAEAFICAFLAP